MPRSSRLLAVLALMVVLVVFAAIPAVSQAEPHYYRNGVLIPEGVKVPILEWGKLSWQDEPKPFVQTCTNVTGGYVENPQGGGAGIGATEDFASYDCENEECPAGLIESEGKEYEKVFEISYPPQSLPWASVLTEAEVGKIRTHMSGVALTLGCYATSLTRAEGERKTTSGPGETEVFPLAVFATCVTTPPEQEEHELKPLDENGTSAGSPSKLAFDARSGTLDCSYFMGAPLRSLKVIGYNASELITVKSP